MVKDKIILSYTAGIMDGEGTIYLYRNTSKTCKRGFRHRVAIAVVNTSLKLMRNLKSWYGGHIATDHRKKLFDKPVYYWRLWAVNEQYNFLKVIEPYLLLKRRQAQISIDFLKNGGLGYRGEGVSDGEFERRENLYKEIRQLNKRCVRLAAETKRVKEDKNSLSDSPVRDE